MNKLSKILAEEGLVKRASFEGRTFDLTGLLSKDDGAQSAGAWVDNVTYGKRRWRGGVLMTPYRAQVSGTIEGVTVDPDAYRNALLKMAPWKRDHDPNGSMVEQIGMGRKLKNGIHVHVMILLDGLTVTTEFFTNGLELVGEDLVAAGREIPEYGTPAYQKLDDRVRDLDEKFLLMFSRPPAGLRADVSYGWSLKKKTSPARDLKLAKAGAKLLLDSMSKIYENI